ncbi:acyl-CoA desaturase [Aspergillus aculeatinus CBS 121060]|uniref:Uncharacterized protein n=1 Tax=Aspergillus aculeatinus CBS 121060 TaxID=1448322 RepID=A0ACD1HP30_9EURO|nr:hypothetical protein BO66DRAFT_310863 [Aspergillus aculeatinus CBS 121060]RAH75184.1 hypothetical protein BO66DRAFT_310863 [Aspergillus aculeatinus CBS 121060]
MPDIPKPHISEQPITLRNWHRHIAWFNTTFIIIMPLCGCIAAVFTPLRRPTAIWAVLYYFWTALGITAGYHRLWSHRTYEAGLPLRIFLACAGGGAVQGSIRWWSAKHRAHHRWTDTEKDPYNIRRGLLYSHVLWMILKEDPKHCGRPDISDLNEDPVVVWQHRNYIRFVLGFGLILPMVMAGLGWGDWKGGLVYAGILRMFLFQQATFCVNSLAHWLGDQASFHPFDDRNSPRDHILTALVTLGEGYHNFHHEFPSDYRNGIEWWQYDPTKWAIWIWSKFRLASNLKRFRTNEIEMGRVQQMQKRLDQRVATLKCSIPPN